MFTTPPTITAAKMVNSELRHGILLAFDAKGLFLSSLLALFLFFHGPAGLGNLDALDQVGVALEECLDASAQQEGVLVAFLIEELSVLDARPFVKHVANDKFVRCVTESEQLGDCLVSGNVGSGEVDGLLDVPFLIFVRLSQVKQQELGVSRDAQHVCRVGDCRAIRHRRAHRSTRSHRHCHRLRVLRLLVASQGTEPIRRGASCHMVRDLMQCAHWQSTMLRHTIARLDLAILTTAVPAKRVDGLFGERFAEKACKSAALDSLEALASPFRNHLIT